MINEKYEVNLQIAAPEAIMVKPFRCIIGSL